MVAFWLLHAVLWYYRVTIVWADKVGFSLKPSVGNTWATRGQTPLIFAKTSWTKLSTIGGITSTGQFLQQTHQGAIKTPQVIAYLTHLLRHLSGPVTVVFDNASIHNKSFQAGCRGVLNSARVWSYW